MNHLNFQKFIENFSIWFQGGVRRGYIIFCGICIILLAPFYFIATFTSSVVNKISLNPNALDSETYFVKKNIPEKDISFSKVEVVPLKNGNKEMYISVDNKLNPNIGFFPFGYTIQILDENNSILSQQDMETYLLPGDVKFLIFTSTDPNSKTVRISRNNSTIPVYYNPESKQYRKPKLVLNNTSFRIRTFTDDVNVFMTIKNEDQIKIKKVDLFFTLRDARESVVGIGNFTVTELNPGEQRDIQIPYTQPLEREVKIVTADWSVNYLDANNISLN